MDLMNRIQILAKTGMNPLLPSGMDKYQGKLGFLALVGIQSKRWRTDSKPEAEMLGRLVLLLSTGNVSNYYLLLIPFNPIQSVAHNAE